MIQNLIFRVYLLISDFLAESLKVNKNWKKRYLRYTDRLLNVFSYYGNIIRASWKTKKERLSCRHNYIEENLFVALN